MFSFAAMPKKSSSARWKQRQASDPFVARARREGLRSRAVYKLEELDQRLRLLRPGSVVIDLGAAPGGWSQYAAERAGRAGRVLALDVLPMDPLPGVEFLQGDFTTDAALQQLLQRLDGAQVNLVMSDMAPNISGMRSVDQPRSMYLAELASELASNTLTSGGCFITKVFMGEGFDSLLSACRAAYKTVKVVKPAASRPESRETYIAASGFGL
jgi:23S rRNA (uridine2552-2'-O)-methyltransferase